MNNIFFSNHENILSNHESMNAIYAFMYRVERRPPMGGRGKLFTEEQKKVLVKLVIANNAICLQEIQSHNIEINEIFPTIRTVSISTIDHVLHQLRMKQLHKVPFERNTVLSAKELRYQYVQVGILHNTCTLIVFLLGGALHDLVSCNLCSFSEKNGT